MRTKMVLAIGLSLVLAGMASAQGRGGFGISPGMLLRAEKVQKELKITDEQKTKIQDLQREIREKYQADFQALQGVDESERPTKFREVMKKVTDETNKALKDVLKEDQFKRLKEIYLQQAEANAIMGDEEVQKSLKVTDEQKGKLKKIEEESGKEMQEIFKGFRENPQESREKMEKLQKATKEKALAVLTEDQKKTLKELQGKPFELKPEDFPRPRRQNQS